MANNLDLSFLNRQLQDLRRERDKLQGVKGGGDEPPGGDALEKRLEKLEGMLPEIREKLIRVESKLESVEKHAATKADLQTMESTLIKWFVATSFAMTALASGVTFGLVRILSH